MDLKVIHFPSPFETNLVFEDPLRTIMDLLLGKAIDPCASSPESSLKYRLALNGF